jgi:LCP family protein required for cell wall assembly
VEYEREEKGGKRVEQKPAKSRKTKKPGRLNRQQKILMAVAICLAVALAGVVGWKALFVRPDLESKDPVEQEEPEKLDYEEGLRPRSDGQRKSKDYYTVLILGRDTGGGGNTDTILLASYDVTNQKATVMSIPRDTMVNVPWDIKRINSVYNSYGGGDRGIQHLYKEISQLVGFEPDYQVIVEWEAVGKIVEAMGGVWFDVPRDMNYEDPYQDLSIHQKKGYRLLSGDDAMQVLRYRHDNRKNGVMLGYPDGDLGRIKTQQALLKAMVEQLLQLKNIGKVNEFAKVFQECVETDLSFQNILWFAQSAYLGGLKVENVNFVTMPNKGTSCWSRTYHSPQSYVVPIASELLELVNTQLSPFVETFTMSDLDIMSVNSDGSVSSSTGHVEDSKAAQAPVKPSKPKPEGPETTDPPAEGTDPGSGTTDPGTAAPGTGGAGTTVPGGGSGGTADPGTGGAGSGTTDPGATDPGTTPPETGDPGTTAPADPGTTPPETPTEPDFSVIEPPPAA